MLYRKMPRVKEELSILGFGCMRFPLIDNDISRIDEEKASEMLRYAIDNGVNYIDTAYPYHGTGTTEGGESEPFVGRVLADGYRDKVMLATKLPSWFIESRKDMDLYLEK
ncbi:MAG: aldo/keto reductase, partial [Bacteroidales bacterium]|nr:aldo/keto reductase [Bacteroidales bacterium]